MQLSVKGRHVDTGDAFRQYAYDRLSGILDKYFGDAIEASVTLSKDAFLFRAALSIHVGRGLLLQATGEAQDVHPAFDMAADRLAKQLRRYKRRLRDHGRTPATVADVLPAQQYILAPEDASEEEAAEEPDAKESLNGDQPLVVAEMQSEVPNLTVGEAVMRMDLADQPALLFQNRAHGGINMVYRRNDGNIGWIDPLGNRDG
ncbi:ribosome hibernation-promoting factor, HPF/YfiA family [Aquibaculum arenosum]|uniref:Ribosome hibernation promoting factor n=1 Tax=Aquibaculum arenosum TaxID=3032591 RepID=A0ABT5YMA2_9PROT|nr:ribosome-associated translation inhibitor RaiA [Fodinicurvata sp. CAU 1616]MDF2096092.1 ribosome-associated translation inhibitor RaiA [Fodinicurvata sp. CAU 1616]